MSTRILRQSFEVTDDLRSRLFSRTVETVSGCKVWTGAVSRNSYGALKIDGQKHDAHVLSWRISHDGIPVPVGKLIMHSCNCRLCINPDHLCLGTSSENAIDAHANGRGVDFVLRGEQKPNAVLTEHDVAKIRQLFVPGTFSYRKISRLLNLPERAVAMACYGHSWRHVSADASPLQPDARGAR